MENEIIYTRRIMRSFFFVFLLGLGILSGCVKSNSNYDELYNKLEKKSYKFMDKFANVKEPSMYKSLFTQEAQYFEDPSFSDEGIKNLKASKLRLTYERLFVFDTIMGNKYPADIFFRKAQYWEIVSMECFSSLTAKQLAEKSKITEAGIMKAITKLNPDFVKKVRAMARAKKNKKSKLDTSVDSLQNN